MTLRPSRLVPPNTASKVRKASPQAILWTTLVLAWEEAWPRLAPPLALLAAFMIAALLGLPQALPGWWHLALLAGVALASGLLVYTRMKGMIWPHRSAVLRRLERDNALLHRPLEALEDGMASGQASPQAQRLWQLHQDRLRQNLPRLGLPSPHPGLARLDRFGLRGALALAFVIAIFFAGTDWRTRLGQAFVPSVHASQSSSQVRFDAWIAPPAYTGLATLFLTRERAEDGARLHVPQGSEIFVQVYDVDEAPLLVSDAGELSFEEVGAGLYKLQAPVPDSDSLEVEVDGDVLASWPVQLLLDLAPQASMPEPAIEGLRHALQIYYRATDDYGVTRLAAELRRASDPDAPPFTYDLQSAGLGAARIEGSDFNDLTAHPWAGLAVDLRLIAEDAVGQIGISEPQRIVLPERLFTHPVARAIIELRRGLILNPQMRLEAVQGLATLSSRPASYDYDRVVALSLIIAERRLLHDPSEKALHDTLALMWRTALRLEDGDLAFAEQQLRDAQEAVIDALLRGAAEADLQALLDSLEQALDEYLKAMVEQALRDQQGSQPSDGQPGGQEINRSDLQDLINQARELAQAGDLQGAQDLLAQLQEILENMRAETRQGEEGDFAGDEMIHRMEDLMQRQQELLDRSFDRSDENGGEQRRQQSEREGENRMDAETQESLRRRLGELMRDLSNMMGEIPESLGDAEQSMRGARQALENDQPEEAIAPQSRAMEQLERGYQSTLRGMMEQYGRLAGQGQGDAGLQSDMGRDPLGRETGGFGQDQGLNVQIPTAGDLERARLLLDELRRRRNDPGRSPEELQYLDRLLNQF